MREFKKEVLKRARELDKKLDRDRQDCLEIFFEKLEQVRLKILNNSEKIQIAKIYSEYIFLGIKDPDPSHDVLNDQPEKFIQAACELKLKAGMEEFLRLFDLVNLKLIKNISGFIGVAERWAMEAEAGRFDFEISPSLPPMALPSSAVSPAGGETKSEEIERAMEAFLTPTELLKFPLPEEDLIEIAKGYEAFKHYADRYAHRTLSALQLEVSRLREKFKLDPTLPCELSTEHCELLALIACMGKLKLGKFPYIEQVFAILALLKNPKGRLLQIRTGEGKSLTSALFLALVACCGLKINLITSSEYLAVRDYEEFKDFYDSLGVTSFHVCNNRHLVKHYDQDILYGTTSEFCFILMGDALKHPKKQKMSREPRVIFIDEVDNLLIDAAGSAARIAHTPFNQRTWMVKPLYKFMSQYASAEEYELATEDKAGWEEVFLKVKHELAEAEDGAYAETVGKLKNDLLMHAYLEQAKDVCFEKTRGTHYVAKKYTSGPKVEIMDFEDTGARQTHSRWNGLTHLFAEVKEGLEPTCHTMTMASMSNLAFISNFASVLFGVSGTLGTSIEREEIREIYGVDCFDIPTHQPCLRVTLEPRLCMTKDAHYSEILLEINKALGLGQAVLVLFLSIEATQQFSAFLKSKSLIHQLLNDDQDEPKEVIIGRAGFPRTITIATNIATRGADIRGLYKVIKTFFENHERVGQQADGRVARQGNLGEVISVLSMEDRLIQRLIPEKAERLLLAKEPNWFQILKTLRQSHTALASRSRQIKSIQDAAMYEGFKRFELFLKRVYLAFDAINLEKLAERCEVLVLKDLSGAVMTTSNHHYVYFVSWARSLIQIQEKNLTAEIKMPIDWLSFLKALKKSGLANIQESWADIFTAVSDLQNQLKLRAMKKEGLFKEAYQGVLFDEIFSFYGDMFKAYTRPELRFSMILAEVMNLPRDYFIEDSMHIKSEAQRQWKREIKSHYQRGAYCFAGGIWEKAEKEESVLGSVGFDLFA